MTSPVKTCRAVAIWFALIVACMTSAAYAATTGTWSFSGTQASATTRGVTITRSGSGGSNSPMPAGPYNNPYSGAIGGATSLVQNYGSVASYTFTFSEPVDNPVLHVGRLGSLFGPPNQTFSSVWNLTGSTSAGGSVSMTRLSGNSQFVLDASGFYRPVLSTNDNQFNCTEGTGAACGSIQFTGTGITSLTFSISKNVATSFNDDVHLIWSFKEATVQIEKQTVGSVGSYAFTGTNGVEASFNLDTTSANPASSLRHSVTDHTQPITATETVPADTLVTASCTKQGGVAVPSSLSGGALTIAAADYGTGDDITCRFVNTKKPLITLVKATLPANLNQYFEVTSSNFLETSVSVINDGLNLQAVRTVADPAADTILTETGVPGWRGAGISCVADTANNGETLDRVAYNDPSPNFGRGLDYTRTIPGGTFISGNAYTCTITNNAIQVRYAKTTLPGSVNQNFVVTTTAGAPPTTINATTGVSAYNLLTNPLVRQNFTETGVAGWRGRSLFCVADTANYGETAGRTAYSSTIAGTAGADYTKAIDFAISPAANTLVAGNAYTCTFTNDRTRIRLDKATSPVADWDQDFVVNASASNGIASTTINASGTANTYQAVTNIAAATVLTEGAVPSWRGYGVSCVADTAVGGETSGNARFTSTAVGTVSSDYQVTIPANTLVGGNDYTCTITNETTVIRIAKVTQGDIGTFVFNGTAANGNGVPTDDSYTVTTATPGAAVSGPSVILANVGTLTEIVETQIGGWTLTSARCEDLNAAASGNPTGPVIGSVTDGQTLAIPAANVRQGAELLCTFTNSFTGFSLTGRILIDNGLGGGTAHNAVADGTEAGLAGVPVLLTDCGGTVYSETTTAGDGGYSLPLAGPSGGSTVCVTRTAPSAYLGVSGDAGDTGGTLAPSYETVTFTLSDDTAYSGVVFGLIATPTLVLDTSAVTAPGGIVLLEHRYTATTTADVTLSLANPTGAPDASVFAATLYRDTDCSATLESSEPPLTSPVAVAAGDQICVIVRVQVSAGAASGSSYNYELTAGTALTGTTATVALLVNHDDIVVSEDGTITLIKQVRNVTAGGAPGETSTGSPGDVLEYVITFVNPSSEPVANVSVFDQTPAYTSLFAPPGAQVLTTPSGMSCGVEVPAGGGSSGYVGPVQWDCDGTLSPGGRGEVAFQVRIDN